MKTITSGETEYRIASWSIEYFDYQYKKEKYDVYIRLENVEARDYSCSKIYDKSFATYNEAFKYLSNILGGEI